MIKKVYKTFRLKSLCIPVDINGKEVRVTFKGGCMTGSTATFTTTDSNIQKELESLVAFGRDFYVDRIVPLEEPVIVAKKEAEPVVVEVEEGKEPVDILDAKTFKNLVELRNALKDKGIDVSQVTNVKAAEGLAKKNGYNYTVEKNA